MLCGRQGGALSAAAFREMEVPYLACWQDEICFTWGIFWWWLGSFKSTCVHKLPSFKIKLMFKVPVNNISVMTERKREKKNGIDYEVGYNRKRKKSKY